MYPESSLIQSVGAVYQNTLLMFVYLIALIINKCIKELEEKIKYSVSYYTQFANCIKTKKKFHIFFLNVSELCLAQVIPLNKKGKPHTQ